MGHVDRGDAQIALDALEFEAHLVAELGVEVRERLVEQEQFRLHDERAGKRQTLLLTAGELGGFALGEMIETDRSQHAHHLVADLLLVRAVLANFQRESRIGEHRHVGPDRVGLEHHAEVAAIGRNKNAPGGRIDDSAIHLDIA